MNKNGHKYAVQADFLKAKDQYLQTICIMRGRKIVQIVEICEISVN